MKIFVRKLAQSLIHNSFHKILVNLFLRMSIKAICNRSCAWSYCQNLLAVYVVDMS